MEIYKMHKIKEIEATESYGVIYWYLGHWYWYWYL